MRERTKKEVRFSARKIKKRAELGRFQGRGFVRLAVDLRLRGLLPERWGEFMRHRMAELSLSLSTKDERRRWGDACLQSYLDALEDTDASVLVVSEAQGRAWAADFRNPEKGPLCGAWGAICDAEGAQPCG